MTRQCTDGSIRLEELDAGSVMKMAADIVVAYLGHSSILPEKLPQLVREVRCALIDDLDPADLAVPKEKSKLTESVPDMSYEAHRLIPAVPIEQSVFPDHLVSLEDGNSYRSLRRHLMAKHGLTPAAYRKKWGLPADYPMVAPDYAKERSDVAKRIGLGRPKLTGPTTISSAQTRASRPEHAVK